MTVLLLSQLVVLVFLLAVTMGTLVFVFWLWEATNMSSRKSKFDWVYSKLLYSYKIKVLHDELKLRNVKMEELNEIMHDALGKKSNKKHVLDQVEEDVKGEVEEATPPKVSGKK